MSVNYSPSAFVGSLLGAAESRGAYLEALLPLAFALFSFRLVGWGYDGPCILVRRSTDNAVRDFGFAAGWLDVAAMLAWVTEQSSTASGYVVTWYDQSGNGRDITYATPAGQMLIVNAGALVLAPNGRPVMLTGSGKRLASAALSSGMPAGAADISIVAATALTLAGGAGTWRVAASFGGSGTYSDPGVGLNPSNQFAAVALGGAAASIATTAGPAMRFCAADFKSGTTVTTYLDGASATQSLAYNIASPGTIVVGGRPAGGVSWHEMVGEVLLLTGTTPTVRARLRADYQAVWGTPS